MGGEESRKEESGKLTELGWSKKEEEKAENGDERDKNAESRPGSTNRPKKYGGINNTKAKENTSRNPPPADRSPAHKRGGVGGKD